MLAMHRTSMLAAGDDTGAAMMVFAAVVIFIAIAIVYAAVDFRRHLRLLRENRSVCASCCYDLRGHAHDCCPECGVAIDVQPGTARQV